MRAAQLRLVGILSPRLLSLPGLDLFLEPWGKPAGFNQAVPVRSEFSAIAGWGLGADKPADAARLEAARRGIPYLALEDGFLRSFERGGSPWSLIADDLGLYYNTSEPSRFSSLLNAIPEEAGRADHLLAQLQQNNLAQTNDAPDVSQRDQPSPGKWRGSGDRPRSGDRRRSGTRPRVIVIDQQPADPAIAGAKASKAIFEFMLDTAVAENPSAEIVLWLDAGASGATGGSARGRSAGILAKPAARLRLPYERRFLNWPSLARTAQRVYTVASLRGLEALIAGTPVTCFGNAFYAGLGLTDDRMDTGKRPMVSLAQLVYAAYARYPRYLDPVHGCRSSAEQLVTRISAARSKAAAQQRIAVVHGVSRWKRPFVTPFIAAPGSLPIYTAVTPKRVSQCHQQNMRLMVWAAKEPDWLAAASQAADVALERIEDGFIRSVGLGSNFTPALSLVVDDLGIYFDPAHESRLERILNTVELSPEILAQAQKLRRIMIEGRFSKYNMEPPPHRTAPRKPGTKVILVPGQVEDDASIRLGSPVIKTNLGLLQAVRQAQPDQTILYKPHPDVESGNRPGLIPEDHALAHADAVISGWDAPSALEAADEIHTMTSLLGVEGLMRSKAVTTYGLPFYAGLGLTTDRLAWPRPKRNVDLDTLIAATFLLYPRYRDPKTNLPVTAFDVLELIERAKLAGARPFTHSGRIKRWIRLTLNRE